MGNYLRLIVVIGIAALIFCACIPTSHAFEVQPAITELALQAGSSTQREILVKNTEAETKTFFLTVQKFTAAGNGRPLFLDPADTSGLPSWLRVSDPTFSLAAGEQKSVRVVIDVPTTAPSEGSYAAVFITEKKSGSTSPVGLSKRIGSLFLVSIDQQKAPADIHLNELHTQYEGQQDWAKWLAIDGQGKTSATLVNEGRSHGTVVVEVQNTVWGVTGKTVETHKEVLRLLPKEKRTLITAWKKKSPIAIVKTEIALQGQIVYREKRSIYFLPSAGTYGVLILVVLMGGGRALLKMKTRRVAHH